MTIGEKIKILREEKGFSQKELADLLTIDRSTITGYETNRRIPDVFTLKKIAQIFDVTTDYLLSDIL